MLRYAPRNPRHAPGPRASITLQTFHAATVVCDAGESRARRSAEIILRASHLAFDWISGLLTDMTRPLSMYLPYLP